MKRLAYFLMLGLGLPLAAQADSSTSPKNLSLVPYYAKPLMGSSVSEGLTSIQALSKKQAQQMLKHIPHTANLTGTGMTQQDLNAIQDKGQQAVNEALNYNRAKILKFLGINPQGDGHLYYFVSFSMPTAMLRAYVLQAIWDGGTLVFKGIDPSMTLRQFIVDKVMKLVQFKGQSAAIALDPRLFDMYKVTVVPTIVYSTVPSDAICRVLQQIHFNDKTGKGMYDGCAAANPDAYWKIEGAVTSDYALRSFVDAGAPGAKAYLDALRNAGKKAGAQAGKAQVAFSGNWKTAVVPSEQAVVDQTVAGTSSATTLYRLPPPFNLDAIGPAGLKYPAAAHATEIPLVK